ncbi:MAG: hypothetical protein LC734_09730 [Acidobacteria bacterium]|nr:hypothetical protein [Acidobacteriota bacterium]
MSGALNGLLSFVGLLLTAVSFYMYTRGTGSAMWLILMIVFLLVTLAFGGMFLSGRVNRGDDIHITE